MPSDSRTTANPTPPPPIVERLRALAQAVIDARQRFAQFEAYIDEVNAADEKMSDYIMNKMVAPDFTAMAAACLCAADFLRDFNALVASTYGVTVARLDGDMEWDMLLHSNEAGERIGASRHNLAEALAALPREEVANG